MLEAIFAILLALKPQELGVNFAAVSDPPKISLFVEGGGEQTDQCLSAGLELRHRFEFQLCRQSSWWFDNCGTRFVETRALQLDPVSLSFKLEVDRFNDGIDPKITLPDSKQAALQALSQSDPIVLQALLKSLESEEYLNRKHYLLARLLTYCRGDTSRTLRKLSYYLSLGLVRGTVFDSGWVSFDIEIPE